MLPLAIVDAWPSLNMPALPRILPADVSIEDVAEGDAPANFKTIGCTITFVFGAEYSV
jgi:hypothetical protein